jgi:hypothetical protein
MKIAGNPAIFILFGQQKVRMFMNRAVECVMECAPPYPDAEAERLSIISPFRVELLSTGLHMALAITFSV